MIKATMSWLPVFIGCLLIGAVIFLCVESCSRNQQPSLTQLEQIQQQQEQQQRQIEQMRPMLDSLVNWKLAEDRELLRQLQTKQSEHTQIKQQYEAIPQRYRNYTSDSIYRAFSKFQ